MRLILGYLFLAVLAPSAASAQPPPSWQEHSGARHVYDLSGTRILVIASEQFNDAETTQMARCWRGWGATVEFAGPSRSLTGEIEAAPGSTNQGAPPALRVDHLLPDVDPSRYDLVYVAGGEGIAQLLQGHRVHLRRIIDGAARSGRVIAAICHGPLALTASSVVSGRRVTANGEENVKALRDAGAAYVDDVVVVDGRLLTGQWPHLETFAVTVAEKLQYPSGGGPFETRLARRPAAIRLLDGLRRTARFTPDPVEPRLIEQAIQASMRTLARSSRGPTTVKYVLVSDAAAKARAWASLVDNSREEFGRLGLSEQNMRRVFGPVVEGASVMLFAFVGPAAGPPDPDGRGLRVDLGYAGATVANLVTAARALGLGVAALDYPPFLRAEAEIKRILEVPDGAVMVNILCLGHAAGEAAPIPVRPVSEVLSHGTWGRSAPIGR